jgi:hypothetical protein
MAWQVWTSGVPTINKAVRHDILFDKVRKLVLVTASVLNWSVSLQ